MPLSYPLLHPWFLPIILLIPSLLACLLVPVILLRKSSSPRLNLPPGPRALPFIGHLHLLRSELHLSLADLAKSHGPLMYLRFGSVPIVVASSPAMARQILQAHDHTFSFRHQPAVMKELTGFSDMLFSQPGPYWKRLRQICATDLLGSKRVDQAFLSVVAEEVHVLLRSVLTCTASQGEDVPVRVQLRTTSKNIISRMALSKRLEDLATTSQADTSCRFINLLVEVNEVMGIVNLGDYIPALARMDLQGCVRRSKKIAQKLRIVWQEVIDGRRREMRLHGISNTTSREEQQLDFLDVLMAASDCKDGTITEFDIGGILWDIFGAAIDTTSIAIEWAIAELLSNPTTMKKVQGELESVVGLSRLVHDTDIPHIPYLCAVVKETMRLHPVGPLLFPHKAGQQCEIAGYDIPKDTVAYVNVWAIGRDPSVWERPLEFWPERFLECHTDVRGRHFELLPFGAGRRSCPGMTLGLRIVQFMLASLLHCFSWSIVEKPDMTEKLAFELALEKPLVAKATPRVATILLE